MSVTASVEAAAPGPLREFATLEEGCAALGAFLGLGGPAPAEVFHGALSDPDYARNLIIARPAPAFLKTLIDNPPRQARDAAGGRSAGELLVKAARSLWAWSRSGLKTVSEETYRQRLAACAACPHHRDPPDRAIYTLAAKAIDVAGRRICALCGCMTASKARMATESCPGIDPARPELTRWGEPRA
jgi:hypothetical protein